MTDQRAAAAARAIVAKFGGATKLSRMLEASCGVRIASNSVQGWLSAGIPVKWQHDVLAAASRAAIALTPEDFFTITKED